MTDVRITELRWADEPIGEVRFPARTLTLRHGIGSGLAHDPSEPGAVWAVADRGPNLDVHVAVADYGWRAPQSCAGQPEAKIMPRLDLGPYLAKLRVTETTVELDRTVRLVSRDGQPVPGNPVPERDQIQCEPAYDIEGEPIPPDVQGMDTEGIAALADGSFWIGEEYGPSLVKADASGRVLRRLVPEGSPLAETEAAEGCLPAIAARRHLNRGFEAVTPAPSEQRLYLAFQSPLAHPDTRAFKNGRHVRLWELDPHGAVLAQYLYPFDPPASFRRDSSARELSWKNLKICELSAVGERRLLVLERSKETSKIYLVDIDEGLRLSAEHLDVRTRPTVEELSAGEAPFPLPTLEKRLLFTSDDHLEVGSDIEGMTFLSDRSLLIVSDNDFGAEDKTTRFFRLDFEQPFAG